MTADLPGPPAAESTEPVDGIPSSLSACIEGVGRGEMAAFSLLYDQLSPIVYGVCLRICGAGEVAEEVTARVFVRMWRLAPLFTVGAQSHDGVERWARQLALQLASITRPTLPST